MDLKQYSTFSVVNLSKFHFLWKCQIFGIFLLYFSILCRENNIFRTGNDCKFVNHSRKNRSIADKNVSGHCHCKKWYRLCSHLTAFILPILNCHHELALSWSEGLWRGYCWGISQSLSCVDRTWSRSTSKQCFFSAYINLGRKFYLCDLERVGFFRSG